MLLSCHQPYEAERSGAEEDWTMAFVARDAVRGLSLPPGLDGLEVLATPMGRLLVAFLREMAAHLPQMTAADAPFLSDATIALLRATLAPRADNLAAARPQSEAMRRKQIQTLIRARLGSVALTPDRLCRDAGLSRSALYRLFEPHGGVAAVIQMERLNEARRRLEEPTERRSIQQIAESVGFYDPSVFSRAFRHRYGVAPREVREAAVVGSPSVCMVPRTAAGGFLSLLSRLEK
jgi:AraC-like DNA-binding protein